MARSKTENPEILVHVQRLESLCNTVATNIANSNVTVTHAVPVGSTTSSSTAISSSCHNRSDGGIGVRRLQSIPSIHNRAKTMNAGTDGNNTGNFAEILTGCVIILILFASLIMLVVWRMRSRCRVVRQPKLMTYVSTVHSISTDLTSLRTESRSRTNQAVRQSFPSSSSHGQRTAHKMYHLKDTEVQSTSFIDGQRPERILEGRYISTNASSPSFLPTSNPKVISVQMNQEVSILDQDRISVSTRQILLDSEDCFYEKLSARNNGIRNSCTTRTTKDSHNLQSTESIKTSMEASVSTAPPTPITNNRNRCGRNNEICDQVKIKDSLNLHLLTETESLQNKESLDRQNQQSLTATSTVNTFFISDDISTAKNSIQSFARDSTSMIIQNPNAPIDDDWLYRKQHIPVISLSQLSMNVRSCPETPLSPRHCLPNDDMCCNDVIHNNCRLINKAPVFVLEYSDTGRCNSRSLLDDSDIFSSESDSQEKDFARKVSSSSCTQHPVQQICVSNESYDLTTHF